MAGRPAHEPTDQQRKQVEAMAGYGIPQKAIARVMGLADKTLSKYYADELANGSTKATSKVAESLYRNAVDGNVSAQIFWMKARAGWSEKTQHEITGKDGGPIEISDAKAKLASKLSGS